MEALNSKIQQVQQVYVSEGINNTVFVLASVRALDLFPVLLVLCIVCPAMFTCLCSCPRMTCDVPVPALDSEAWS
jgi:uncharacterized protein YybS (DUF2232 family)